MQFRFDTHVITVNIPDRAALLQAVRRRLEARRGFALATINLDHLVKLHRNRAFRAVYAAQDLVVADGNPIVWLSRLARRPVSLVPGADMVLPLVQTATEAGVSIALVGATDTALAAAATRIRADVAGVQIALLHAPPMGFDPDSPAAAALLQAIADSGAGLCLLALGAPKQEQFAARGRQFAPHVGFASIGAGLDFLAGTQDRAPAWVRAVALEWLWRALSQPRRLVPRYVACAAILPGQALAAWRLRRS